MLGNILQMLLIGIISGVSEILPISATAHRYLLSDICGFGAYTPLLSLCLHMAVFLALVVSCKSQIGRLYLENRIAMRKKGRRKRQPDISVLANARLLLVAAIPVVIGICCYNVVAARFISLLSLAMLLMFNGVVLYLPQYIQSGSRSLQSLSPADGLLIGTSSALCACMGMSCIAPVFAVGQVRKGKQTSILEFALHIVMLWTLGMGMLDFISLFSSGVSIGSIMAIIGCLLAAVAAFFSAYGAVSLLRYFSVKIGFSCFSYYNWGLGFAYFILYLII